MRKRFPPFRIVLPSFLWKHTAPSNHDSNRSACGRSRLAHGLSHTARGLSRSAHGLSRLAQGRSRLAHGLYPIAKETVRL